MKQNIATIDAMGCRKEIAVQIVRKQVNYFLSAKNQPEMPDEITNSFKMLPIDGSHKDVDYKHGRINPASDLYLWLKSGFLRQ